MNGHHSQFDLHLSNALEDLSSRFIVNLPEEELESMERVLFQVEQAHWYYEDFIRPAAKNPSSLPSYSLKYFSLLLFKSCPLLTHLVSRHEEIWDDFQSYKNRVPVCGAILISDHWDKVLLVRGFENKASWSFPRGKINKEEPEADCAIREVLEETGYDITPHFPNDYDPTQDDPRDPYFVELVIKEQRIRLYFISEVSESTLFQTRTRKEIGKIDWFLINDLPVWKNNNKSTATIKSKPSKHYMLTPFVSHLKLWIQKHKPNNFKNKPKSIPAQSTFLESDQDFERSTSPSSISSEDVNGIHADDEEESVRKFTSLAEGNLALQEFIFGPSAPPKLQPVPILKEYEDERFTSPLEDPLEAKIKLESYQKPISIPVSPRRPSFDPDLLQPVPKTTSRQTSLLLALLTNQDPVASPPPNRKPVINPPTTSSASTSSSATSAAAKNRSTLLNVLNDLPSSNRLSTSTYQPNLLESRTSSGTFNSPTHLSPGLPSSHYSPSSSRAASNSHYSPIVGAPIPLPILETRSSLMDILNNRQNSNQNGPEINFDSGLTQERRFAQAAGPQGRGIVGVPGVLPWPIDRRHGFENPPGNNFNGFPLPPQQQQHHQQQQMQPQYYPIAPISQPLPIRQFSQPPFPTQFNSNSNSNSIPFTSSNYSSPGYNSMLPPIIQNSIRREELPRILPLTATETNLNFNDFPPLGNGPISKNSSNRSSLLALFNN